MKATYQLKTLLWLTSQLCFVTFSLENKPPQCCPVCSLDWDIYPFFFHPEAVLTYYLKVILLKPCWRLACYQRWHLQGTLTIRCWHRDKSFMIHQDVCLTEEKRWEKVKSKNYVFVSFRHAPSTGKMQNSSRMRMFRRRKQLYLTAKMPWIF